MTRRSISRFRQFGVVFVVVVCAAHESTAASDDAVDYNRDIRPLLSNTCYQCHGPDANERQSEFRLDVQESALGLADSGEPLIVPGDSAASLIVQRITADDPDEQMPPADSGKSLTAEQIELIKRWIDQGATWRGHWAFITPQRPEPPAVKNEQLIRGAIDRFIFRRLEQAGLQPSPEAAKTSLIRRVTFDLTGLPPTLKEIDDFLADDSPDAYERVVDRLLKSPRYGEHRTRYWLDAARYGDTHGLHLDNKRQLWPYRDWVIQAFNSNMPFDQFTIEQLAGDLLPEATLQQKVATGFNRCNVTTSEGGSIAEEYLVRYAVDRVETTSTVWMGLTAGCAVCHDHKFDPLSQTEFYQLFAYFNSLTEKAMDGNALLPPPVISAPTPAQQAELDALRQQLAELNGQLAGHRSQSSEAVAKWEAAVRAGDQKLPQAPSDTAVYCPLDEAEGNQVNAAGGSEIRGTIHGKPIWDSGKFGGALRFDGNTHVDLGDVAGFERTDKFSYGAWVNTTNGGAATVLSRMDDAANFRGYDMYLGSGKIYIHIIHNWDKNAIRLNTTQPLTANQWQHVMMTYDGSSKAEGVQIYVDGQAVPVEITHNSLSDTIKTPKPLRLGRRTNGAPLNGLIDDVRIYARQLAPAEVALVAGSNPIHDIVSLAAEKRTPEQTKMLVDYYLENNDEAYQQLAARVAETNEKITATEAAIPQTMVMEDMPQRRPAYRLIRGEYDKPDTSKQLQPDVPAVFPPLPESAPTNRLALARWLVDPAHPLTARVTVNRYWQQLFGTGIVKTAEDFGSQGEWPSHPELLDWLAVEFIDSGWDVKHMLKLMVMSHAYRQSARVTPALLAADKDNRLLARGPRFRLDAEMVRDNALSVSGLLVEHVGGPSVKPYQPGGLWEAVGYSGSNTVKFTQDHGESLYRRSMYIFWKRTSPPPTMQIFDAPSREYCVVRRERTNTPSIALALMNDVQFVEAARRFGERIMQEGGVSAADRITFAFRLATARRPTADELASLTAEFESVLEAYQQAPDAALQLCRVGEAPRNEQLNVSELAAWTIVANTILNLDETITK